MNRLELEKQIIQEGNKRGIVVTNCKIYDRDDYLEFHPEVRNNYASIWTYKHQVEELIHDLSPIERLHEIGVINLDISRYDLFNIEDEVEVENIWIRLDAEEKEPEDLIKIGSTCGQWRRGWVKGIVFETPKQNDRALGIKFNRDIYIETEKIGWISDITGLERLVREEKIKKVEAGQPIWCGTHTWTIRKP